MAGRWNYSSYKKPMFRTSRGFAVKIIIICGIIAAAVLLSIFFLVPYLQDLFEGRDPGDRYHEHIKLEMQANTNTPDTYEGIEVSDAYIYEIKSNHSMKNDPYYDGNKIVFSTDTDKKNVTSLNSVVLYSVDTLESVTLENVKKKYDNILMTKMSGNYIVWVDCMLDGAGRICGYDLEKKEQFTIKEFGYAIPEISICGNYIAFMQVAGETEQRIYVYDLASRSNVTVRSYQNADVTCGNVSISGSDLVWCEYSRDGRGILNVMDLTSGNGSMKEYNFGDYVFEPKTNGEYILYSSKRNSLEGDLMLSHNGEKPVKIASNVLEYEIGDDFAVYSKDQKIYVVLLEKPLQAQVVSGDLIRAKFASLNGNRLCFYDVTDDFGLIDSVRFLIISKEE